MWRDPAGIGPRHMLVGSGIVGHRQLLGGFVVLDAEDAQVAVLGDSGIYLAGKRGQVSRLNAVTDIRPGADAQLDLVLRQVSEKMRVDVRGHIHGSADSDDSVACALVGQADTQVDLVIHERLVEPHEVTAEKVVLRAYRVGSVIAEQPSVVKDFRPAHQRDPPVADLPSGTLKIVGVTQAGCFGTRERQLAAKRGAVGDQVLDAGYSDIAVERGTVSDRRYLRIIVLKADRVSAYGSVDGRRGVTAAWILELDACRGT